MVHSTLVGAVLFLLADLVAERRGAARDELVSAPSFRHDQLLAGLFFLAAIAAVGMPPVAGFIGKLLILDAARDAPLGSWIWWIVLTTSLLAIIGFGRAGSLVFWRSAAVAQPPLEPTRRLSPVGFVAASILLAGPVLLAAFAGPAVDAFEATTVELLDPVGYVRAVLGVPEGIEVVGR
jgi:multicomponent K+:H+ antiporter subunit D